MLNMKKLAITILLGSSMVGLFDSYATEASKPVSENEKKVLLEKESSKQKALRDELRAYGGKIYFNSNTSGQGAIYVAHFDGKIEKINTALEGGVGYPRVSPDGKRLLFSYRPAKEKVKELEGQFLLKKLDASFPKAKRKMGDSMMVITNLDGSEPKIIGRGWAPAWSPDGKRVVFNLNMKGKRNRPIAIADLEKGEEHIVSPPNWTQYRSCGFPVYSPYGKWVISSNQRPVGIPLDETGLAMKKDGRIAQLIAGKSGFGCNHEVSADGKWFVWTVDTFREAGGWLRYAPLSFKKPQRALKMKLGWKWTEKSVNYDPYVSPDSKYLVYMHGASVKGKRSYDGVPTEIYAMRFPPDGVNVRLTWFNASSRHPEWVGGGATDGKASLADREAPKANP